MVQTPAETPAPVNPEVPEGYTLEELPVGPLAGEMIHRAAAARYTGDLRGIIGPDTARAMGRGEISERDLGIVADEIGAAHRRIDRGKRAVSEAIPDDIPESAAVASDDWSPSDALKNLPPREFDGRERAANEHNDRKKD